MSRESQADAMTSRYEAVVSINFKACERRSVNAVGFVKVALGATFFFILNKYFFLVLILRRVVLVD